MMMTTVTSSPGTVSALRGSRAAARVVALAALCLSALVNAADTQTIFTPFDALLRSDVRNGQVNYPAFAESTAFAQMIDALATTTPTKNATQAERLAFYINAYNAVSIQGILDGYSPSSIWGRQRFFKRRKYDLFDTSLSLYTLEHERIISEGDPRIHFAIVCSSQSCPPLRSQVFTAADLDAELDAVTAAFINNSSSNRFDLDRRSAQLSRIFKWYGDEFEAAGNGNLGRFLARYVDDPALRESLTNDEWDFEFLDYDWSLNGTPVDS
ncbi:MAG: DUF547 domain-containing protein [Pseudomonadota bacterium]